MKRLLFAISFLIVVVIAFAQYTPAPGGGSTPVTTTCVGFPGNTTGTYLSTCQPSDATGAFVCTNSGGCTTSADWVIAYPVPPTSGLVLWLKSDCVTQPGCNIPANTAAMVTWFNLADGLTLSKSNGVAPAFATAQVNGLGAFNFTNCRCLISSTSGANTGSSGFALVNTNTAIAGTIIGANTANGLSWYITTGGVQKIDKTAVAQAGLGTTAISTGTWHIIDYTVASGSGVPTFRVDRAADPGTGTATQTYSSTQMCVGDYCNTDTNLLNALLSETIMYNRVVSSQEKTNIESYLHLRCGC